MTDEELEPSAADRRLAEILKGTVDAFELDPSEPPRLFSVGGGVIKHPAWPLDPWLVRRHDVLQLEDLGLVGSEALPQDGIAFCRQARSRLGWRFKRSRSDSTSCSRSTSEPESPATRRYALSHHRAQSCDPVRARRRLCPGRGAHGTTGRPCDSRPGVQTGS